MNIIGNKYGKLLVLEHLESKVLPCGQKNKIVKCLCDCGVEKEIRLHHLIRNRILSCGCKNRTRNGLSNTPILKIWRAIKYRTSENYFEKHLYFNKGIKVCKEWLDNYELFVKWANENGYKKGLHIDRIDNSKGYNPENCRFVTAKINTNNRDNTIYVIYKKEKYPIKIILDKLGKEKNYRTILGRIKRGWNHELAIDTPIRQGNYNKIKTLKENEILRKL